MRIGENQEKIYTVGYTSVWKPIDSAAHKLLDIHSIYLSSDLNNEPLALLG